MKASYKAAIGLASISVVGAVALPQVGFGQTRSGGAILSAPHDAQLDKVVTRDFEDVNVNQVFAWLVEQGFTYQNDDDSLDDARVSLNVDHRTVLEAAQELADQLGGRWDQDGCVYMFHRNGDGSKVDEAAANSSDDSSTKDDGDKPCPCKKRCRDQSGKTPTKSDDDADDNGNDSEGSSDDADSSNVKSVADAALAVFQTGQDRDSEKKWEEWGQKFGQQFGNMNSKQWEDFAQKMQGWGDKFGQQFSDSNSAKWKEFDKKMEDWSKNFSEKNADKWSQFDGKNSKQWQDYAKKMEEWSRNFSKQNAGKWQNFQDKNSKAWDDYSKKMDEWGKQFGKEYGSQKFAMPDKNSKEWQEYERKWSDWAKQFSHEWQRHMKDMPKMPPMDHMHVDIVIPPLPPMPALPPNAEAGIQIPPLPEMPGQINVVIPPLPPMPQIPMTDLPPIPQIPPMPDVPSASGGPNVRVYIKNLDGVAKHSAVHSDNLRKLMKSLSPHQRNLEARRGYLTFQDLTSDQRGYLGGLTGAGTWSIDASIDGSRLKLRSK